MTEEIRLILKKTMLHIIFGANVDQMKVLTEFKDEASGAYKQEV